MTDLLERKGDTPLLLRPGVKIEDDCLLLLFTPVLCASTQYLMYVSFFLKYSHRSTLCTEMFFSTKESGSTASQPFDSTLLWNVETEVLWHISIHEIPTCHHLNLHDHHLGLLLCPGVLEGKTASIRTLDKLRLYKPWHKLPGCSPS